MANKENFKTHEEYLKYHREYNREWAKRNPNYKRDWQRKWRADNPELARKQGIKDNKARRKRRQAKKSFVKRIISKFK